MSLKQYSKLGMQYRFAEFPQMGDALYSTLASANGDEGRAHQRTVDDPSQQVSNAFDQTARQVILDGFNESSQIPTGSFQSKTAVSVEQLAASSKVPVVKHPDAKQHGGGFYTKKQIGLDPDNPNVFILAHELGHAKNDESLLGRMAQHPLTRGVYKASPLIALLVSPSLKGSGPRRVAKSIGLSLAMSGPALAGEASASYKGYQILKEHGATEEELDAYIKQLLKPQSTYLIRPALAAALLHTGTKIGAAHKLDRRMRFRDLLISIETDKGNCRHWYDPHTDTHGKTKMQYPYGYIRKTEGLDGDHVDCFIGPNEKAPMVYVITTNKGPDFKTIDEQKCMLGFDSAEKAKEAFMAHYTDKRFFNKMTALAYEDFEKKVLATSDKPTKIGTFNDQVPGEYLGFPASSLVGLRTVAGDPLNPQDKIDKNFQFHDMPMNTSTLDPSAGAVPTSPGV